MLMAIAFDPAMRVERPVGRAGHRPPLGFAERVWELQPSSPGVGELPGSKIRSESPARGVARNVERPVSSAAEASVSELRAESMAQMCEAPNVARNAIEES